MLLSALHSKLQKKNPPLKQRLKANLHFQLNLTYQTTDVIKQIIDLLAL